MWDNTCYTLGMDQNDSSDTNVKVTMRETNNAWRKDKKMLTI